VSFPVSAVLSRSAMRTRSGIVGMSSPTRRRTSALGVQFGSGSTTQPPKCASLAMQGTPATRHSICEREEMSRWSTEIVAPFTTTPCARHARQTYLGYLATGLTGARQTGQLCEKISIN